MSPRPKKQRKSAGRPASATEHAPRIIAGDMRGRTLAYHGDRCTRPMKDRVREAVFNLVGPAAKGRLVLDLFAGTGALGLEALSRGARRAVFVERHFPTLKLIQENVRSLGVEAKATVLAGDTFYWCGEGGQLFESECDTDSEWLVLISPPYEFYQTRTEEMLDLISRCREAAPPGSLLVVESDLSFDAAQLPQADDWDVRSYSPAQVAVAETSRLPK